MSFKIPKTLFIRDIFKEDCVNDDIFERKILQGVSLNEIKKNESLISPSVNCTFALDNNNNTNIITYSKIPAFFTNLESWPTESNLRCWNCHLNFDKVPVFIPQIIEPIVCISCPEVEVLASEPQPKFSISTNGVFCRFGCAYKFINTKFHWIGDKVENINKLKYLFRIFYPTKSFPCFVDYPCIYDCEIYGGKISLVDFKKKIEEYL
jgi:hypothetical protein